MTNQPPDVFALPEDHPLRAAHRRSIHHRAEIEASAIAGCFSCQATFPPSAIVAWTDTQEPPEQQTALCPRCGIDSVIGDTSGFTIDPAFLAAMHEAWF